jgi:hypothetical protein
MNSGLVEARELAARMAQILRGGGNAAPLEEFAATMRAAWNRLLSPATSAGPQVRALPGADPWVQRTGARILACVPASGDDLEPLLKQIGLTATPP